MHSHGIRHDDIKPGNVMFLNNKSFLIDFNLSSKMLEPLKGTTVTFVSRAYHEGKTHNKIHPSQMYSVFG